MNIHFGKYWVMWKIKGNKVSMLWLVFLIGRKRNNVSPFVTIWFVLSDHLYMSIHFDANRSMLDSDGLCGVFFRLEHIKFSY